MSIQYLYSENKDLKIWILGEWEIILIVICEGIFLVVDYFAIYRSAGIDYNETLDYLLTTLDKRKMQSSSFLIVNSSNVNGSFSDSSVSEKLSARNEEEY